MTIIALIKSNEEQRTIAEAEQCLVVEAGAGTWYFLFTFPELRKVEKVLQVEIETNPETFAYVNLPQDKTYLGNTVGMTLTGTPQAGTTLCAECVVIGF